MPSRDTSMKLPLKDSVPPEVCTRVLCRNAVAHTPMMGWAAGSPFSATADCGSSSTMVWTLDPARVSLPTSLKSVPYSRSNTRRSRKNESSAWPA